MSLWASPCLNDYDCQEGDYFTTTAAPCADDWIEAGIRYILCERVNTACWSVRDPDDCEIICEAAGFIEGLQVFAPDGTLRLPK